eukprot:1066017-Pelagomonas_calceolata.AAC.9
MVNDSGEQCLPLATEPEAARQMQRPPAATQLMEDKVACSSGSSSVHPCCIQLKVQPMVRLQD